MTSATTRLATLAEFSALLSRVRGIESVAASALASAKQDAAAADQQLDIANKRHAALVTLLGDTDLVDARARLMALDSTARALLADATTAAASAAAAVAAATAAHDAAVAAAAAAQSLLDVEPPAPGERKSA